MALPDSRFSKQAQALAEKAMKVAALYQHTNIGLEHVLLACLDSDKEFEPLFRILGINSGELEDVVTSVFSHYPRGDASNPLTTDPQIKRMIDQSLIETDSLGEKYVTSEIIFLALVEVYFIYDRRTIVGRYLETIGMTPEKIRKALQTKQSWVID